MCTTMCSSGWPMLLDLTKDECRRILRNLELEAYSAIVSVFRAQGDLNKDKKQMLKELQQTLSISTERHRAEIRRAVNDEKLTTVADCLSGPDISSEWNVEGRRLVPIMPRLVPQTAFTVTADMMANQQSKRNMTMPQPAATGNKELAGSSAPMTSCNAAIPPQSIGRINRAPSPAPPLPPPPTSNVLVLPSGMSIHIKDELPKEEEIQMKPRRRTSSAENMTARPQIPLIPQPAPKPPAIPQPTPGSPPIKITKSPAKHHSVTTTPSGQKVIIVSSTMSSVSSVSSSAAYSQRAVSAVPLVKTSTTGAVTTTVNTHIYPRTSVMATNVSSASAAAVELGASRGSTSNVITIAATSANTNVAGVAQTSVYHHSSPSAGTPRPRVRTITARPRPPQAIRAAAPGITPQPIAPSTQNIHIRPVASAKPTIHIKQEGSMKIITQGTPSTAGRILPKPSPSQVLVVTTATVTANRVGTPAAATATHLQGSGKVLNISTSGGRILATSLPRTTTGSNVVTVNPKALQLTTIKGATSSSGVAKISSSTASVTKPNVIVVQKAQSKKGVPGTPAALQVARTSGPISSPFEKELVSFLARQEPSTNKPTGGASSGSAGTSASQPRSILERRVGRPPGNTDMGQRKHVVVRQKSEGGRVRSVTLQGNNKSSILADLIQAVGVTGEGISEGQPNASQQDGSSGLQPQNQWVEYDVQSDGSNSFLQPGMATKIVTTGDATDASAIRALLDLQAGGQGGKGVRTVIHRTAAGDVVTTQAPAGEIVLEPMSSDDKDSDPDIQIVGTSGLDDAAQPQKHFAVKRTLPIQRQKLHLVDESGSTIQLQIADSNDLGQLNSRSRNESQGHEIVGEIDPRTGALITSEGLQATDSTLDEGVAIQVISSEDHEAEQAALLAHSSNSVTSKESGATKTIILSTSNASTNNDKTAAGIQRTTVIDPASLGLSASNEQQQQSNQQQQSAGAEQKIDFLSSALNQAQIDLDSFLLEENGGSGDAKVILQQTQQKQQQQQDNDAPTQPTSSLTAPSSSSSTGPTTTLVSLLGRPGQVVMATAGPDTSDQGDYTVAVEETIALDEPVPSGSTSQVEILEPQENLPDLLVSTPASTLVTSANRVVSKVTAMPGKSFVSSQQVQHVKSKAQFIPLHEMERKSVPTIHVIKSTNASAVSSLNSSSALATSSLPGQSSVAMVSSVSVATEPVGLDPSHMKLEDLSSQQHLEGEMSSDDVLVTGGYMESAGDVAQSIRLSKRKRKAPTAADEISSPTHSAWTRAAMNVLQRVMRVRGSYKEKGELNAASWFTQPVDPREVPDYYSIIENPMDFATIKKKLETNQYLDIEDFRSEMLLVRDNCHRYNPAGTEVRRDCEEVFNVFNSEYDKALTRLRQGTISSPNSKKGRLDRSPIRH